MEPDVTEPAVSLDLDPTCRPRRGGRSARVAERAGPMPDALRPIRPGIEGGAYRPLSAVDEQKINAAALDVLEKIGLADAIPSCVEACTAVGAVMGADGRLRFPRAVVEDTLAKAARRFPLCGQDPRNDMEPWGRKVYFGTAGAAVHIIDPDTGDYRDSTAKDLFDIGRVVDACDNIHFYQRAVVCRDLPLPHEMDFNTCYAAVSATTKHVGASWVHPDHVTASLEMLHMIAGGEAKWRERPFVSQSNCFVVPPLKFAEDACKCLEVAVRGGMPVLLLSAGQAGATAPASLAGTLVQAIAECLAGLVYVNAIKLGAPAIFGPWPFVSDLRTGAMSGGSPEQALLSAALGQMGRFYDLTLGTASGMCDAKMIDAQSGMEKAYNHALVGNAGANLIYESAGMHASLLCFSLESLVVDNDLIGAVQRTMRGITVDDEAISIETIRATCVDGPGHYLGSDQTMHLMQRDYVYPAVGDRWSPNEWNSRGRPSYVSRAKAKTKAILDGHWPTHIAPSIDEAIRARFPVRLAAEAMRPPM